ncbi:MAG: branched-chain amino acid ABC transporter permease [Anaerolineae bacterium]|nr:MAG: branched-chain amino acid ABC transporter permease [Anaerolineae bacterium]
MSERQGLGQDEWVAREEARQQAQFSATGRLGRAWLAWQRLDDRLKLLIVVTAAGLLPLLAHGGYVMRVAGLTGLYAILAVGLNAVAGFAGLLDLGYVAFYGLGAYAYALLASPQFDAHWPFWLVLPLVVLGMALLGRLLGSPSLRLRGDYLAIVTLGFGQIASLLFLNLDRVYLPFLHLEEPLNLTGGPNGIIHIDDLRIFGYTLKSPLNYYYTILVAAALVFLAVYHLDRSRTGRAWRAIREDELAAQAMGVNVHRFKLLAFSVGAAIAGMAGVLFAAWQGAVFPSNFGVAVLIMLYAMVVLGGVGSIWGPICGAVILSLLPEVLQKPEMARLVFYGALILSMAWLSRRSRVRGRTLLTGLVLLGGVILLGIVLKAVLTAVQPGWFVQPTVPPSVVRSLWGPPVKALNLWMLYPQQSRVVGNVAFLLALFLLLGVWASKGAMQVITAVPALYALAFAWETRLVQEPSVTRMLILGVLLVVMMNHRPRGLFGKACVYRQLWTGAEEL